MAIPELDADGFLPIGIYDCTIDEIEETFGSFNGSDRRVSLFLRLKQYYNELLQANIGKYLIVNGSFISDKGKPSDIDVLLVFRDDLDVTRPVPPYQYNARSRKYVKTHYHLDFHFGFDNDPSSTNIIDTFHKIKEVTSRRKGFLRIRL
ncbi:MAG: DUF6932 family protein [Bacteroidota bacterium]